MASLRIVDTDRVAELQGEFGADDMAFVVEAFLEETADALAKLSTMLSDGPDDDRARLFHFICGSARTIGAEQLADSCKRHELENSGLTAGDVAALQAEFRAVRGWFQDQYGLADPNAA